MTYIPYIEKRDMEMYRDAAKSLGRRIRDTYDLDDVEVNLSFGTGTYLDINKCSKGLDITMSFDMLYLGEYTICEMIEQVVHENVDEGFMNEQVRRIGEMALTDPEFEIKWTKVDLKVRLALGLLKEKGLLDDLPKGTRFMRSESCVRRWIQIPMTAECVTHGADPNNFSIQELAIRLYSEFICPMLVRIELAEMGEPEESRVGVVEEMNCYALNTITGQ